MLPLGSQLEKRESVLYAHAACTRTPPFTVALQGAFACPKGDACDMAHQVYEFW